MKLLHFVRLILVCNTAISTRHTTINVNFKKNMESNIQIQMKYQLLVIRNFDVSFRRNFQQINVRELYLKILFKNVISFVI